MRHSDKVYSLNWCPTGRTTLVARLLIFPSSSRASASFDATTKVWDAVAGTCLYTLSGHMHPVYSVDFHPSGQYLATGSFDFNLLIWSTQVIAFFIIILGVDNRLENLCRRIVAVAVSLKCAGKSRETRLPYAMQTVLLLSSISKCDWSSSLDPHARQFLGCPGCRRHLSLPSNVHHRFLFFSLLFGVKKNS